MRVAATTLLVFAASCAGGKNDTPDASNSRPADARTIDASVTSEHDATPWCAGYEFKGHCYVVRETTANIQWLAAKAACEQEKSGGHLVTYESAEENESVISATKPSKRAWIGLHDRDMEGKYMWVTGEPFVYTNWRPSEPSNGGNTGNEDCASQSIETDNWKWNDLGCEGGAAGTFMYICEYQ